MLDQNTTTLLAALIGGLLSALGGFLANYYIQSSSNKTAKREKIHDMLEVLHENVNQECLNILSSTYDKRQLTTEEKLKLNSKHNKIRQIIYINIPQLTPAYENFDKEIKEISKRISSEDFKDNSLSLNKDVYKANSDFLKAIESFAKDKGYSYN